jgi:hypothetical protein
MGRVTTLQLRDSWSITYTGPADVPGWEAPYAYWG